MAGLLDGLFSDGVDGLANCRQPDAQRRKTPEMRPMNLSAVLDAACKTPAKKFPLLSMH